MAGVTLTSRHLLCSFFRLFCFAISSLTSVYLSIFPAVLLPIRPPALGGTEAVFKLEQAELSATAATAAITLIYIPTAETFFTLSVFSASSSSRPINAE